MIPCQRFLFTGNSDHDADCDLNVQTTSHITPSPSSVSSPTLKTTSGGQTSTLRMTEETTTTSSTEATEPHTIPTSTTTILQSTDSGEPSANTETSKQWTSLKLQDPFHSLLRTSQLLLKLIKGQPEQQLEEEVLPVRDSR